MSLIERLTFKWKSAKCRAQLKQWAQNFHNQCQQKYVYRYETIVTMSIELKHQMVLEY